MKILALWLLALSPAPRPKPDLTPAEVVRTVVAALQNYNSPIPNAGIFTAYTFASPANHAVTGPYGNFIGLVKSAVNEPLLHRYPTELGTSAINGGFAVEIVTVHRKPGLDMAFRFTLSHQQDGRYRGCWMVDGVSLAH